MRRVLHIANGDAALPLVRAAAAGAELWSWREAMIGGPCPGGASSEELLDLRAQHLAEAYGGNVLEIRRDLGRQERRLGGAADLDEVVLWFEDDLFCHVHLWYVAQRLAGVAPLSLVCGPERLGELTGEEAAALYTERRPLDAGALRSAAAAWRAYSGDDPRAIASACQAGPLPGLPFAAAALRLHLERFPAVEGGLGRIERRALEYAAAGSDRFGDLFRRFQADEPDYGLGDAQLLFHLRQLAGSAQPLVQLFGDRPGASPRSVQIQLTAAGHDVLAGRADRVELGGVDTWLGGVHLQGRSVWRWDDSAGELVPP